MAISVFLNLFEDLADTFGMYIPRLRVQINLSALLSICKCEMLIFMRFQCQFQGKTNKITWK